jgi:hypothetical protein
MMQQRLRRFGVERLVANDVEIGRYLGGHLATGPDRM